MAAIASTNLTHTTINQTFGSGRGSHKRLLQRVQFGDGALTYPAGGVPIDKGKLGCPTFVTRLTVVGVNTTTTTTGAGQVPLWMWDGSNTAPKLKGYEYEDSAGARDIQALELDAADTPIAQDLYVEVEGY